MTARSNRPDQPLSPLPEWIIWVGTLVVVVVAGVVALVIGFVLWPLYGGQRAPVQLDAIRTAGTLVIGTGGAVALLLTARRQRYTELALVHTDRDATERRITELYTKAAELLGSDQAPVRLTGLYALERLAHSTVEHRQSIVDVICAYLRMPYTPPHQQRSYRSLGVSRLRRVRPLSDRLAYATPTSRGSRHEQAQQEQQVRLTAQNILSRNFRCDVSRRRRWWHRAPPPAPAWPGIRLDLTGALLLEFDLSQCQLDSAVFTRAQFVGRASFGGAQFTGEADFGGAQFTSGAFFGDAQFTSGTNFERAEFIDSAYFGRAEFTDWAVFTAAQFTGESNFTVAQFTGTAYFGDAQFTGETNIGDAKFTDWADFKGARVASAAESGSVWPLGWTTRPAQLVNGEDPAFQYLTWVEDGNPPDT